MMGGLKETVSELAVKVGELYKELVTNTVQFTELRQYTKETLSEFKHSLERLSDKLEASEKDRIRRETELLSKINALEARLEALSQQALHAYAKDAAVQVFEKMLSERKQDLFANPPGDEKKQLPEKLPNEPT
jgi:excinuclease UvrABC nuclease subunit